MKRWRRTGNGTSTRYLLIFSILALITMSLNASFAALHDQHDEFGGFVILWALTATSLMRPFDSY